MKHLILRSLMLIAGLSIGTHVFAHDFTTGGIYYNKTSENTVEVTYKGSSCFEYDNEYKGDVVIPTRVTYGGKKYLITSIGSEAFYDCDALKSVKIGNSVTSIGSYAFSNCTSLSVVYITDLEAWCKIDFYSDSSNPLSYAKKLYLNDKKVTNLVIPNTIAKIKNYAFCNCDVLTSVIIPNPVRIIGEDAFCYCDGLTSVTIGNSVTSIGSRAFYGCSSLTGVTIPNSVTSIGKAAFYECGGLTSVTIGSSVTSIGNYAFSDCTGLTSVISLNTTPPICGKDVFDTNVKTIATLIVPQRHLSVYKSAATWGLFTDIVGKDMSGVEETLADDVDTPAEYYNLNGVRVENPSKGVFIKRQGNKTTKVVK